jgi:hypothetical protein
LADHLLRFVADPKVLSVSGRHGALALDVMPKRALADAFSVVSFGLDRLDTGSRASVRDLPAGFDGDVNPLATPDPGFDANDELVAGLASPRGSDATQRRR